MILLMKIIVEANGATLTTSELLFDLQPPHQHNTLTFVIVAVGCVYTGL